MSIHDITRRAVLALGFEEGVGTRVFDSSPKHNNGILGAGGAAPTWVAGKDGFGGALEFTNDYVNCGNDASLDTGDEITISIWINLHSTTGNYYDRCVLDKWDSVNFLGFNLRVGDGNLNFLCGNGVEFYRYAGNSFSLNNYHKLVITIKDDILKAYIDGVYSGGRTVPDVDLTSTLDLIVGSWQGTNRFFDGLIDEVIILPYALTAAEVRMGYESRSAFTATPNLRRGLVLDYDFQEGAGMTLFDKSWYRNNGTLGAAPNTPTWVEGCGLDFDGVDDKVVGADYPSLRITGDITVMFRVKPDVTANTFMPIVYKDYAREWFAALDVRGDETAISWRQGDGAVGLFHKWPNVLTEGEVEYHITFVRTETPKEIHAYKNAMYIGTRTYTKDIVVGAGSLTLGDWTSYEYNGITYTVKVFNRIVTPTEIRALYAEGR